MVNSLSIGEVIIILLSAASPTYTSEVVNTAHQSLWPTLLQEVNCSLRTTSNHSGQCHCNQFLDIRCHGLDQVPQFVPDDRIYSGIYMADQGVSRLPQGAFFGLKVRYTLLDSLVCRY